jgi:hypothetical protein
MLALRQIHSTGTDYLTIQLPDGFKNYPQVEIIILPVETDKKSRTSTEDFVNRFAGAIPDFPDIEKTELQEYEAFL